MENVKSVFFFLIIEKKKKKQDGKVLLILDNAPFWGFAVVSAKTACMVFGKSFSQIFCPHSYFFHKPSYFP